jgi:hypothetical protein
LPLWLRAGYLALTVGVAALVYFAVARILRVSEARDAISLITRRLRG